MYICRTDLEKSQLLKRKDRAISKKGIIIGISLLAIVLIGVFLLFNNTQAPIEDGEEHFALNSGPVDEESTEALDYKYWWYDNKWNHRTTERCKKACEKAGGTLDQRKYLLGVRDYCYVNNHKQKIYC